MKIWSDLASAVAGVLLRDPRVHPRVGDVLDDDPPLVPLTVVAVLPNEETPRRVGAERRATWMGHGVVVGRWRGTMGQWRQVTVGPRLLRPRPDSTCFGTRSEALFALTGGRMGLKKDIKDQVTQLLAVGDYTIQNSETIPGPGDNRLNFANTGVQFTAVTLYIDMRGSTAVLNAHRPQSVAKIHKAYLFLATKIIAENRGQVRSYNGDSILAFFPGTGKPVVSTSLIAAGQIRHMLVGECASEFARYRPVDFGIGIDVGPVFCVKAGMGRNDNHNDLIWLGNAVNRANALSDAAKGPAHVWVSDGVRALMEDRVRLHPKTKVDLWTSGRINYNGASEAAWKTEEGWDLA